MSDVCFALMVAAVAVAVIQQFFKHSRSSQRRFYWVSTCVAAIAAALTPYPDWRKGLALGLFIIGAMGLAAYGYTPYIKIRGRIYALNASDSRPEPGDAQPAEEDPVPDSYGGLATPRKLWWVVVAVMAIASVNVRIFAESGATDWTSGVVGLAFIVFFGPILGLGDASWGYGIARGQKVQFVIASILTVGVFPVLYLIAYWIGKRKPVRRRQSMEYRAHPRHQRLE